MNGTRGRQSILPCDTAASDFRRMPSGSWSNTCRSRQARCDGVMRAAVIAAHFMSVVFPAPAAPRTSRRPVSGSNVSSAASVESSAGSAASSSPPASDVSPSSSSSSSRLPAKLSVTYASVSLVWLSSSARATPNSSTRSSRRTTACR
jgi:hypothetical protein